MNTRYVFAVLIGIVLGTSGCKDDDKGSLTLVFRSTFDGKPLVATDIYDYAFGQRIQFTRSEFYISNLRLVAGDGSAVELSTIELIDMTASTAAAAEDGVRLSFNDLPARN